MVPHLCLLTKTRCLPVTCFLPLEVCSGAWETQGMWVCWQLWQWREEEVARSLAGLLLQESGQRALMWADGRARLRLF